MTPANVYFEERVEQLFDLGRLIDALCREAGVPYRIVGGLATYLYVESVEPSAGRLTRDIDILIRRADLPLLAAAAPRFGLEHRHAAGLDMLISKAEPSVRRGVHLVFSEEKVLENYAEPSPAIRGETTLANLCVAPLEDLVRMKLTSFRAKDETHLKDLDEAGLLSPEMESRLAPKLLERLRKMRERD